MATQSGNSSYGNPQSSSTPRDSSTRSLALDNLLRRELRIGDPNNPKEVAEALLTRYKERPQALSLRREAAGVPYLSMETTPTLPVQTNTSSDAELQQALDDVNRDLKELTTSSILKDITPELEGWGMAIRAAIQDATQSARFALDRIQRDKTFGLRRTLGDYARMARFVGALTPSASVYYRKLAQSLDEVAAVLLVQMGEALANVGFGSGRFLLQVPYSELQVRRDAVIYSLRNLMGSTQEAYGQNDWPRGLDAYRRLYSYLERQGQGDLRVLLVENELVRIMDALIQRAGHGSVEGLRYLGSTAQIDIQRLRRLVIVSEKAVDVQSPPLTSFISALQLFVEAFESAGGFRLLRIARPPILFYGLYGMSESDEEGDRLVELTIQRNLLADQADCFLQCGCQAKDILCQIILDKVLYDIDRAIDLYSMGTAVNTEPVNRAVAYSYVVDSLLFDVKPEALDNSDLCFRGSGLTGGRIVRILTRTRDLLFSATEESLENGRLPKLFDKDEVWEKLITQELQIQLDTESKWSDMVKTMAPSCIPKNTITFSNPGTFKGVFDVIMEMIAKAYQGASGDENSILPGIPDIRIPRHYEDSTSEISERLEIINRSVNNLGD